MTVKDLELSVVYNDAGEPIVLKHPARRSSFDEIEAKVQAFREKYKETLNTYSLDDFIEERKLDAEKE